MFDESGTLKIEYATSDGFYCKKVITSNVKDTDQFLSELTEFLHVNRILNSNDRLVRTTQIRDYTSSIVSQLTRGQH
jgi:hypothetical protein